MNNWALYPVFVGTILSIVLWTRFVLRERAFSENLTLSELAAKRDVKYFRFVLWLCGPLFGLTTIFYILPRLHSLPTEVLLVVVVLLELVAGIFLPVNKRHKLFHELIAYTMGLCMFVAAVCLALVLPRLGILEAAFSVAMLVCVTGMGVNRRNFIYYEVAFIFISHFTIVTAVVSLI